MGDRRRFDIFAKAIAKRYPLWFRIADVAGGKGYLQLALKEQGFKDVTTFEPKVRKQRMRKGKFCWREFNNNIENEFDLLVGLHPDEATDVIIIEAAKKRIPFAIVPCCVKPTYIVWLKNVKFSTWIKHLQVLAEKNGFETELFKLKMNGKNVAIFGRPI